MQLVWIFCLIGFGFTNVSFAAERVEIVKAEGGVSFSKASGGKSKNVTTKSILPAANVVSTDENGRAVIQIGNTGYIVMEKNSQVEINTVDNHAEFFRHLTGIVYYAVNSLKGKDRKLDVRTKASTIGIRGTRFLVTDEKDHSEIGMRKGTISVTSLQGDFEIHKQSEQDEFEAMKKEGEAAVNKRNKKRFQHKSFLILILMDHFVCLPELLLYRIDYEKKERELLGKPLVRHEYYGYY